ncbi:hypothetical protein EVAR_101309_1 [Eumeta japonica]|uniref:Uncharacterized protein n=1 Tax=Eumeta variegata TaxID=151549 RepID=A0A4C2ADL7_EUMVA|nr:hypothetical protein EVAR_101309_1 [Eumeta japonica]
MKIVHTYSLKEGTRNQGSPEGVQRKYPSMRSRKTSSPKTSGQSVRRLLNHYRGTLDLVHGLGGRVMTRLKPPSSKLVRMPLSGVQRAAANAQLLPGQCRFASPTGIPATAFIQRVALGCLGDHGTAQCTCK